MCDVVLHFDALLPPSKLDIEAWNSEITEVYVATISRKVYQTIEKVATRRRVQSVVAGR
jgi:selenophosphate synthetase-related protein